MSTSADREASIWRRRRFLLADPDFSQPDYFLGTDLDDVLEDFEFTVDERQEASPRAGRLARPPLPDEG